MADITRMVSTGPSAQRVDIVFVAEGYQASERSKFLADVSIFSDYMLSVSSNISRLNDPFSAFAKYFNVSALFVASAQSGTDQPNKGIYVDTYFNSTQYGADGRLNYGDQSKLASVLSESLTATAREISVVLINSNVYGGAGGASAWATTGDIRSAEVVLHEIGHSFASLEDEYADPALVNTYPLNRLDSVHVTSSLSNIPWRAWMDYTDELGKVGTYEGGYYRSSGVWRATLDSKMLSLGKPFSAPQKEAFVLAFYRALGDYLDVRSDIPGLFIATVPDAEMVRFAWSVNGQSVKGNDEFFDAYGSGAYQNGRVITLTTTDNSGYLRTGEAQTKQIETRTVAGAVVTDVASSSYIVSDSGTLTRMNAQDNQVSVLAGVRDFYLDGGLGIDTLVLNAASGGFELSQLATGTTLFLKQGRAELATTNVEMVKFSDKTVWIGGMPRNLVTGGVGNDTFRATGGNDGFDGGGGIDTVIFAGARDVHSLLVVQGAERVVSSAASGTDVFLSVERLQFADRGLALDLQVGDSAGRAALALGAAVGPHALKNTNLVSAWLKFFDEGKTITQAAQTLLDTGAMAALAGGADNASFVQMLYRNVMGEPASATTTAVLSQYLDGGLLTRADMFRAIAELPVNQAHIDLVGLQKMGLEYAL